MSFTKLHATILDSSVWLEPAHVRIVWITMLAMADQHGVVHASVGGLAHRARVSKEECEEALAVFLGPDPDSRDETSGERIEKVAGGWLVLNHANYRDRQTKQQALTAERVARHRAKHAAPSVTERYVTDGNATSPDISADLGLSASVCVQEAIGGTSTETPKKGGKSVAEKPVDVDPELWSAFLANRREKKKPLTPMAWRLIANRIEAAGKTATEALTDAVSSGWADWREDWTASRQNRDKQRTGPLHVGEAPGWEKNCAWADQESQETK